MTINTCAQDTHTIRNKMSVVQNVLRFTLLDRALYCALFQNFPSGNCKRKTSGWCFWNIATFSSFSIKDMLTLSITKFIKPSRDSLVVFCICSLYSSKEIWWQAEEMTGGWPCSVCRYFICLVTSDFMSGGIVKMCFRCLIMKEMRSCAVFLKQKKTKNLIAHSIHTIESWIAWIRYVYTFWSYICMCTAKIVV